MSPPRKRQKLDHAQDHDSCIAHELDLEIALRERLAAALESRITWALLLQNTLSAGVKSDRFDSSSEFQNAALDALVFIDAPCDLLFNRDDDFRPNPTQLPLAALPQPVPLRKSRPPPAVARSGYANPKAKPKFLYVRAPEGICILTCPTCSRTAFTSLQGLLNHTRISHKVEYSSHDECISACAVPYSPPAAHQDDSAPPADANAEPDLEGGVDVGHRVLPGLRRLFEIAVGNDPSHASQLPFLSQDAAPNPTANSVPAGNTATHLTLTLGHHKDSPALAPFLGQQAKRRCINVYDDDVNVDVYDFSPAEVGDSAELKRKASVQLQEAGVTDVVMDEYASAHNTSVPSTNVVQGVSESNESPALLPIPRPEGPSKRVWRMPYAHRSVARPALEIDLPEPTAEQKTQEVGESGPAASTSQDHAGTQVTSRFHIVTRIVVADHSRWLPDDVRPASHKDHTHQWMVAVTAPSYSLDITSILVRMNVTSITEPTACAPISASAPPFIAMGTSVQPFLARVELIFAGVGSEKREQKMVLEHWVELDLMKSARPVKGDEQVVDVELDRDTVLLPVVRDYTSADSRTHWDIGTRLKDDSAGQKTQAVDADFDYIRLLKDLLPRFPMTLQDAKGRPSMSANRHHFDLQLPYKLVATPAQLRGLVAGRRKAIEWGRARALQAAYMQAIPTSEGARRGDGLFPLTTADVYAWLAEDGHFLRDKPTTPLVKPEEKPADQWCGICGIKLALHPSKMWANIKQEPKAQGSPAADAPDAGPDFVCDIVPQSLHLTTLPSIDITRALSLRSQTFTASRPPLTSRERDAPRAPKEVPLLPRLWRARNLVAAADPQLTLAVRTVVGALALPSFVALDGGGAARHPQLLTAHAAPAQVDARVAPHALLALAMKAFARVLVGNGVTVGDGDRELLVHAEGRRRRVDVGARVLTPSHVLRGLRLGLGRQDDTENVVLQLLARAGVPVDAPAFDNAATTAACEGDGSSGRVPAVKLEDDSMP